MSSEKRISELKKIRDKINKSDISLSELANLSLEYIMVYANNPAQSIEEFTKEEFFLGDEIDTKGSKKYFAYIDQWEKNQVSPNEQELKILQQFNKSITDMLNFYKQSIESTKQAKQLSEEEKKEIIKSIQQRQEGWKKYQPILKQLIEQERERESEEEEKNSIDSSPEEQTSPSPKSTENSSASSDSRDKKNGTPWHIIIPVGILVIVLIGGLATFLIWHKKNNEKSAKK
ncbi:hypothetical protein [endosymbiont GvMRE of Glomus versiforme]|uniref:hypothetical protein n=1 Tax=endosymbiont GvMRE of Glomus versiforme TaxID=2039283 RepID=UPI000ED17BA3|nr:hypothetical protein [endosymbiont GvMRE of Glomus versiforme]RHZ36804.1 hypothetical protein GvMRE_I2g352 [endosymbiont GvMRE of Glomus versiforme]